MEWSKSLTESQHTAVNHIYEQALEGLQQLSNPETFEHDWFEVRKQKEYALARLLSRHQYRSYREMRGGEDVRSNA